ncbi:MAG: LPS-assembly protein LptD, partial [Rhodospirillaceae bacterium]
FQGLASDDDNDETPLVIPLVDFSHVGERDRVGGRSFFDFNMLALTRAQGTDTRRIALHPRWERPYIASSGDVYKLTLGLNTDVYHVNSLVRDGDKTNYSGFSYRAVPYMAMDWRRPMVKRIGSISQILEPIASLALAPNGGNPDKIPNEDSTDFEFDETNLFSDNRFTGIDRLEGGPRINYGLNWGVTGAQGGHTNIFFGQSYRLRTDDTFAAGSGLEENFSDWVGKVEIAPGGHFHLLYRTRLANDNFAPRRNEIQLTAGVPAFRVAGNYVFLESQEDSEFDGREEANLTVNSQINREWRASVSTVRDMDASEVRSLGVNLIFENECLIFNTGVTRTFFEDRDIQPTDTISFLVTLKTIGEVKTGFSGLDEF